MHENQNPTNERVSSKRGFAAMPPEQQRAIASLGGRTAHQQGVAHQWNKEEAMAAGRKGGQVSGNRKKSRTDINPAP